ncbi:lytic transglycosylase domain-containing protein [Pedobacter sp. SYSU D00535]|uniref:lytic transglycosylase domain-containing protein n=1 Tax=Pedobacter sp. SYSU D00535 TaxID=2810308 RepID=UPI001A97C91C|nr:lytic transglycosylase domain-containing protein [Pedobacter sp. SYSU D00535]
MRNTRAFVLFSVLGLASISYSAAGNAFDVTVTSSANPPVTISGSSRDYQESLEALEKTVPLAYNESVKRMINYYSTSQKSRFSRVLGLAEYYFPIYEKIFRERGIPEEIKYLSIVESSLNPYALSSAQAGGLWQFLEPVGKIYGLNINDTIDERRDPYLACNAAASYLLDSYEMYKDWVLAIASYNCGRNNIRWAMEKAGGATDYWSLREYLPVETQNYVPAYIATVYLMNNARKHGIYPKSPDFSVYTKEIQVQRPISLSAIARAINVSYDELGVLNAAYKNQFINGSAEAPKRLIVPAIKPYIFDALAAVLTQPSTVETELKLVYTIPVEAKEPVRGFAQPKINSYVPRNTYVMYRVQAGDTLSSIAEKFEGATEEEIRVINKLKHQAVKPGMVLRIIQG